MTTPDYRYPRAIFSATGVELEYMIVDERSLDVRPIADRLLADVAGEGASDAEPEGPGGVVGWSNELALHVIEFKTIEPIASLSGLADRFQDHVRRAGALLAPHGARLLPAAMHPWMDPARDMRLWPHEYTEVYRAFDRIFGCTGHGWANLQSTHVNLPFADDAEFGRLHAAVRAILPLIPAIAASSPVFEGRRAHAADQRLEVYRTNARAVPEVTGRVIPEPVYTRGGYERDILGRLYDALRPHDAEGVLHHEWANARGCIARFDRGSIEIRLIDVQECPRADIALVALIVATVRALAEERWAPLSSVRELDTEALHAVLLGTIARAERARVGCAPLLRALGVKEDEPAAGDVWRSLHDRLLSDDPEFGPTLSSMLAAGTLSTRLAHRLPESPTRDDLRSAYRELADCLARGELFGA